MPRTGHPPEPTTDNRAVFTIVVVPFEIIGIHVIHPIGLKAIEPGVIIGREIIRCQRAGIGAVGDLGLRNILLIFRRVLLINVPVAGCKRSCDQHKLNAGGLFHNGVAALTATIKIL